LSGNFVITDPSQLSVGEKEFSAKQAGSFFLELERLLDRVECSTTHYQILGLERSANHEQVNRSYLQCVALFYPSYNIGASVSGEMASRIERAFNKVSQSYSVLASFNRRKEYDAALHSIASKTQSLNAAKTAPFESAGKTASPQYAKPDEDVLLSRVESKETAYKDLVKEDNRRRSDRHKLAVPARVTGHDRRSGKWHEMSETIDVSRTGLTLRLRRRVRHGMVLYLTLPLPTKLRSHGYTDPGYNVYALVRRVEPPKKGVRVVGFEFLGEHPPAGYLERPWAVFRTKKWVGTERRRASRIERSELVRLEFLTESMESLAREETRTENLSRKGFRVAIKAAPMEFDLVRVSCPGRGFECLATLRNRFVGKDGRERLCLQLIDKDWPL
jgi:curved DNA-binding protein CbpA